MISLRRNMPMTKELLEEFLFVGWLSGEMRGLSLGERLLYLDLTRKLAENPPLSTTRPT